LIHTHAEYVMFVIYLFISSAGAVCKTLS